MDAQTHQPPLTGGHCWGCLFWTQRTQHVLSPSFISSAFIYQARLCARYSAGSWNADRSHGSHARAHSQAQGTDIYNLAAVMIQRDVLLRGYTGYSNEYRTRENRTGPNKLRQDPLCPPTNPPTWLILLLVSSIEGLNNDWGREMS